MILPVTKPRMMTTKSSDHPIVHRFFWPVLACLVLVGLVFGYVVLPLEYSEIFYLFTGIGKNLLLVTRLNNHLLANLQ